MPAELAEKLAASSPEVMKKVLAILDQESKQTDAENAPEWEPETGIDDTEIEEVEFVRTSADRGEVGISNSTKPNEQTCDTDDYPTTDVQKMSGSNRQRIGELGEQLAHTSNKFPV